MRIKQEMRSSLKPMRWECVNSLKQWHSKIESITVTKKLQNILFFILTVHTPKNLPFKNKFKVIPVMSLTHLDSDILSKKCRVGCFERTASKHVYYLG